MASSLMATPTNLTLHNPITSLPTTHRTTAFPGIPNKLHRPLSKPNFLSFSPLSNPIKLRISASISPSPTNPVLKSPKNPNPDPVPDILSGSTRTVTTLAAVAVTASKFFAHGLLTLAAHLKEPLFYTAGPAFFAAAKRAHSGPLNTPFTVVAAGMAKWLDLYSGVLMVRVLLSWFPNIPWDRQPLSAIRDLCDPYLNLFRNIIPPLWNTLDISPLFAFSVLGVLGTMLNASFQSS